MSAWLGTQPSLLTPQCKPDCQQFTAFASTDTLDVVPNIVRVSRPVRTWSDGAAGTFGPDAVKFITTAKVASDAERDKRHKRRRHARLAAEAERAAREPLIRAEALRLLGAGIAKTAKEAWRLASYDRLKTDLAAKARHKLPLATDEGIRRRVNKELDIRDALSYRADAKRSRLEHGYMWWGGEDATGRERQPFVYKGLRSDEHAHLKLFASCLPKARPWARAADETELKQSLMVGTKEFAKAVGSKLLGLDKPYVEGQKSVRGFIRIDCDGVFASWDALRLALVDALESVDLLPHIVVADELSDGRIIRPHFIWLLPEKSRIRFDSKALPGPQRLYHAIARALTAACIPIGGDVGGLSNMMRVKNPLSPHWSVAIANERDPLCLADLMVRLEPWMSADEASMAERQTAVRGAAIGIDACQSNQFFRDATAACWSLARQWIADGDERGGFVGDDLAEAFTVALGHDARHAMASVPPRKAMAMLGSVCRWAARHFDPSARRRTVNPGALRGQLDGLSLNERQAAGGRHAASTRRDASLDAIRAAVDAMMSQGEEITKAAVARRAGIAYRTVLRLWDEAATSAHKAPKTSVFLRMTDSLRKIATQAPAAQSNPIAAPLGRETIQSVSQPAVLPTSAPLLNPTAVPHPHDADEDDETDDATVLAEHDAWLETQEWCCSDSAGDWNEDLWFDAA